jgi:hypothetical protein
MWLDAKFPGRPGPAPIYYSAVLPLSNAAETGLTDMNNFIARQPIFNKKQDVLGYEVLFRSGSENYFSDTGVDASAVAMDNFLLLSSIQLKSLPRSNRHFEEKSRHDVEFKRRQDWLPLADPLQALDWSACGRSPAPSSSRSEVNDPVLESRSRLAGGFPTWFVRIRLILAALGPF